MATKNKPFSINGTVVPPGKKMVVDLPAAKLYTHNDVHIPIQVLCGKLAGPTLFVSAAIHGDELNGVEIARRLVKLTEMDRLRGTLVVIPIVNVFGIIQHSRYLPDRRDLNRCFPGSERGSLAARLAYMFVEEIVKQCDYGVDLHTGAIHRTNLPQVRANLDDKETRELAETFPVPVLLHANLRDGSLREVANEYGVKMLLYEAGEALRFEEASIRTGVRGVTAVMRKLGMLPKREGVPRRLKPYISRSSYWERAPESGILRTSVKLGAEVIEGQILAVISDPSDLFNPHEREMRAEKGGIVIGKSNIPLVNEGDAVFHIASFKDTSGVSLSVEVFQSEFDPMPS